MKKNNSTLAALCACLLAGTACSPKPHTSATANVGPEPIAANAIAPAVVPLTNGMQDKSITDFAPCLTAAETTKSVTDNEDGLRTVQFLMTCSENYLSAHPSGPHGADALRLWYKGIAASNEILRGIESRTMDASQNPAEAQRRLVSRETIQHLATENGYIINRAFQYYTIQTFLTLYEGLKASGIKMESAIPGLNEENLSRKRTGVWELSVDGAYDNGNFIVVREFSRKDPQFNVSGFGVFGPYVAVSDGDQIDRKGWYGQGCSVKITAEEKSFTYGCDDYLTGKVINQMVKDMRKTLEEAMLRKDRERSKSPGG